MHPLGEISLFLIGGFVLLSIFRLIEHRIEVQVKQDALAYAENWVKQSEGDITNEYVKLNQTEICEGFLECVKQTRKDHKNDPAVYTVQWTVQLNAVIEPHKIKHSFRDTLAQFSLDLKVADVDIANLVDSFRVMEHEDVRTMWRAKFGEEQVSVDDVMGDAVGAALFEVLTQDLEVERMYDTYRQTLYFKLKHAGS